MAETEEKVQETQVSQQGDTQVVREKVSAASSEETRYSVVNAIWLVLGVLETLLVFRFILKLLGANPDSGFTDFVYTLSGVFTAPFRGIFSAPTTEGDLAKSVFETSTLVAIIVYALVAGGLVKLATLNRRTI
jgi:hypothetical protein